MSQVESAASEPSVAEVVPEPVIKPPAVAHNPLPEDFSPSPMPEAEPMPEPVALTVPAAVDTSEPSDASGMAVPEYVQDAPPPAYESEPEPLSQPEYQPAGVSEMEMGDREDDDVPPPMSTYESYAASMDLQNLPEPEPSVTQPVAEETPELPDPSVRVCLTDLDAQSWIPVYRSLPLGGVTRTIGSHCEYIAHSSGRIDLRLDEQRSTLYNDTHRERIEKALSDYFDQPMRLQVDVGVVQTETPAAWRDRKIAERLQEARDSIYSDANVQSLVDQFSAVVLNDSIQPVGNVIK